MIKLSSKINEQIILYNFSDYKSVFFDDKFYKYININYIYFAVKNKLKSSEYRIDDPNHVYSIIHTEDYIIKFVYDGLSLNYNEERQIFIVLKFVKGICKRILIQDGHINEIERYEI